jgi:hypothetical protein
MFAEKYTIGDIDLSQGVLFKKKFRRQIIFENLEFS